MFLYLLIVCQPDGRFHDVLLFKTRPAAEKERDRRRQEQPDLRYKLFVLQPGE